MNRFALSPFNFDQLVDELFQPDFFNRGKVSNLENNFRKVPVNIQEDEDKYTLSFLTPGIPKEAIQIDLDEKKIAVSYELKEEKSDEQEGNADHSKVLKQEFRSYSFKRSFSLNERVDRDAISAHQENGILTITLPKKEESKPVKKTIAIG